MWIKWNDKLTWNEYLLCFIIALSEYTIWVNSYVNKISTLQAAAYELWKDEFVCVCVCVCVCVSYTLNCWLPQNYVDQADLKLFILLP
jgi:hypothetical protein